MRAGALHNTFRIRSCTLTASWLLCARLQSLDLCVQVLRCDGVPALAVQAAMQVLKYLLRRHEYGMRFVSRDGVATVLSLSFRCHFAGACSAGEPMLFVVRGVILTCALCEITGLTGLSCSLLRRVLEEPRVLLVKMMEDIGNKYLELEKKVVSIFPSQSPSLKQFLQHTMSAVGRNPQVFVVAAMNVLALDTGNNPTNPALGRLKLQPWFRRIAKQATAAGLSSVPLDDAPVFVQDLVRQSQRASVSWSTWRARCMGLYLRPGASRVSGRVSRFSPGVVRYVCQSMLTAMLTEYVMGRCGASKCTVQIDSRAGLLGRRFVSTSCFAGTRQSSSVASESRKSN